MEFRPCIDIHNGKVKQIVGGSLKDEGNMADENFVSGQDAVFYANLYKKEGFRGGHIILLNARDSEYYEATKKQAMGALQAYPGGLQVGGGITDENAEEFLTAGASHVIVTSYVFCDGKIQMDRLKKASECGWKRASGFRFKLQEKRWKVLYCDRPLAEVHRADDHRRFVRAACRLL
ncbi:putative 1-(5-phosphoribosyl)-5-[(5-phosphoribosylamino)methylideneamino]imidazole-4-carboxamide isomerase [Roseburia inulinivorans DSM 16841]|uniref:Putative 1-(5-phosphoribosyl)-5-[(5-phosphoribosylamino)methylideneamino]imidazole-4-carboxamide isomerase n=1 Tax=Roseburia inulinivorans DSM 16841 TaxID=622312 RepID=C0FNK8_9FIRM|nr:putative 1-(5-phosphoribosyl)-5-[(5-phosphoribosylamino)methylideneamino]imidazole-4-carboxamide isomerase [Roseburia inulinivorans DSM 16841]